MGGVPDSDGGAVFWDDSELSATEPWLSSSLAADIRQQASGEGAEEEVAMDIDSFLEEVEAEETAMRAERESAGAERSAVIRPGDNGGGAVVPCDLRVADRHDVKRCFLEDLPLLSVELHDELHKPHPPLSIRGAERPSDAVSVTPFPGAGLQYPALLQ